MEGKVHGQGYAGTFADDNDDDEVYLNKLQRKGVTKSIL
jgi:hypothetical protein